MLRGYRGIVVAAFGLALIGASPKPEAQPQAGDKLDRIAAALERFQLPDKDAGCERGKDDRRSDLCAQWKSADAAYNTMWASIIGLVSGFATLFFAWRAAHWAKEAARHTETGAREAKRGADAAMESLDLSRLADADEFRPWVIISSVEIPRMKFVPEDTTSPLVIGMKVFITVKNIGKTAAHRFALNYKAISLIEAYQRSVANDQFLLGPITGAIDDILAPGEERVIRVDIIDDEGEIMRDILAFAIDIAAFYSGTRSPIQHVIRQVWLVGSDVGARNVSGFDIDDISNGGTIIPVTGLRCTYTLS